MKLLQMSCSLAIIQEPKTRTYLTTPSKVNISSGLLTTGRRSLSLAVIFVPEVYVVFTSVVLSLICLSLGYSDLPVFFVLENLEVLSIKLLLIY